MQKARSGPFYTILIGSGILLVLFSIFLMTSDTEHILISLLTHVFSLLNSLFKNL